MAAQVQGSSLSGALLLLHRESKVGHNFRYVLHQRD
eukprot:COSAG02_NODE_2424_length_8891_cov_566.577912_8_plen_36_part_00